MQMNDKNIAVFTEIENTIFFCFSFQTLLDRQRRADLDYILFRGVQKKQQEGQLSQDQVWKNSFLL